MVHYNELPNPTVTVPDIYFRYCPGGPDSDFEYSTQSYTGYEPTSMRAIRARYNPYLQTRHRIEQVKGHMYAHVSPMSKPLNLFNSVETVLHGCTRTYYASVWVYIVELFILV